MNIARICINNFRGIKSATLLLPGHVALIGDNNVGKTTILEAIDLALGPDRLNRFPPIDEHDFFQGRYLATDQGNNVEKGDRGETQAPAESTHDEDELHAENEAADSQTKVINFAESPRIEIEVTIADLSKEQLRRFNEYIEFWDRTTDSFYDQADPAGVDVASITEALRVTFLGTYDPGEDDFEGKTYYTRSLVENDNPVGFYKKDKQICGFLYLRSLRTGSRALSLERGSLLDIILRLKEVRPQMWEDTIGRLSSYSVAADPDLGISGVLESINVALKKYVPKEWGVEPHLMVSNLTREHLRKVITAFIATGSGNHTAPFYRQGRGTINMLVLAMLSQIAEDKQNVIFAMEEPETAIPPYAQKRIVHEIRHLASQTIFTSHSPYVLEEFDLPETVVLTRDSLGVLSQFQIELPNSVKPKRYRQEFRTRFCEGLLARRILVAEGATETTSLPVVCRRLAELQPDLYTSLEALGICTIDAGGENNIADLSNLYSSLGKQVFAVCDSQDDTRKAAIEEHVEKLFVHDEDDFEDLVLNNTTATALRRYSDTITWPAHLRNKYPNPEDRISDALLEYFNWKKGNLGVADFLAQCEEPEIPEWLKDVCETMKAICNRDADDRTEGV